MVETRRGTKTVDKKCGDGSGQVSGLRCYGVEDGFSVYGYEWHGGSGGLDLDDNDDFFILEDFRLLLELELLL